MHQESVATHEASPIVDRTMHELQKSHDLTGGVEFLDASERLDTAQGMLDQITGAFGPEGLDGTVAHLIKDTEPLSNSNTAEAVEAGVLNVYKHPASPLTSQELAEAPVDNLSVAMKDLQITQGDEAVKEVIEAIEGSSGDSSTGSAGVIGYEDDRDTERLALQKEVESLFAELPEMNDIGTQDQYVQFLQGVFPQSTVRDVYYHGTSSRFEQFNTRPAETSRSRYKNEASFFTRDSGLAGQYKGEDGVMLRVLLDVQNPREYPRRDSGSKLDLSVPRSITGDIRKQLEGEGYDAVVNMRYDGELAVFEPEQIHILGSDSDKEGFRSYVAGSGNFSDTLLESNA